MTRMKTILEGAAEFERKFEIRESKIQGLGVFARTPIQARDHIFHLTGELISAFECTYRVVCGQLGIDDPLQVADSQYLVLDRASVLFNHSCDPNALIRGRSDLLARNKIWPGQEITFDYSATVKPSVYTRLWRMKCRCGSPSCRRYVSDIRSINANILSQYLVAKGLQDYILEYLNAAPGGFRSCRTGRGIWRAFISARLRRARRA